MHCGFDKIDLANIINIIEVCSKRGAFQAEEMSGVGKLYDKLKASLEKVEEKAIEDCVDGVCNLSCGDGVCEKDVGNVGT
tara:strand:+ start:6621 stop:6860 length:240 start_codon:yes stop_codon:yes gene_type:complete